MSDVRDIPFDVQCAFWAALNWVRNRPAGSGAPNMAQATAEMQRWWAERTSTTPVDCVDMKYSAEQRPVDTRSIGVKFDVTKSLSDKAERPTLMEVGSRGHLHPEPQDKYDRANWGDSPLKRILPMLRALTPDGKPLETQEQLDAWLEARKAWRAELKRDPYIQSSLADVATKLPPQIEAYRRLMAGHLPEGEYRIVAQVHDEVVVEPAVPKRGKVTLTFKGKEIEGFSDGTFNEVHRDRPRFRCAGASCPEREPTVAAEAPTCYTCGRRMAVVP